MTDPHESLAVALEGTALLTNPLLNKGTAFSEAERSAFALHGLLPPHIGSLEDQKERRLRAIRGLACNLDRYNALRGLQDANETLFYALLVQNLEEMLPLVYTPTVGEGCQTFSHYWHYPRGLFLSYPYRQRIDEIIAHPRFDNVEAIVVSDGERILGLGDQGAGGMGIPIGKLSLYTACAGLHPRSTLPILLDVGTDNPELLAEPVYVGWRHERMRGEAYDDFIEHFVSAVSRRWPHVLLQWEDFARANAGRILARYRDRLCTFNDDIQGTAAVAAGTLLAAVNVTQHPLSEQRIVIVGAGSAGCGIAALILRVMVESGVPQAEARQRFFAVDRDGLLLQDTPGLLDFQKPFAQPQGAVADWRLEQPGRIELYDVVANAKPSVLIGVSGQPGIFSERVVRAMAAAVTRPVILPLSNPTSRAEAIPEDLMRWTDERAVIGTGSPFPPIQRKGRRMAVDQTNNAYIFPGVGLAVLAAGARRVTDGMFAAAARALAAASPAAKDPEANLLPAIPQMRSIAVDVALAVARQARNEGQCVRCDDSGLEARVRAKIWEPRYCNYRHAGAR